MARAEPIISARNEQDAAANMDDLDLDIRLKSGQSSKNAVQLQAAG
jgi:hypothetical protein